MSISQTQIKGTVVLNSDAGANLTIGNSTATNSITGTTNINGVGSTNTSLITIGNATAGGITTLASPTTNINNLTLSKPITSAYTVVPTSGQLGFLPPAVFYAGDATLATDPYTTSAFTNISVAKVELTAGTYIITGSFEAASNANAGHVVCCISPTQNGFAFLVDYYVQSANSSTINLNFLATSIIQVTITQFYYLTCRTSATGQIIRQYKLRATRIA
jgi:hypothetical protein